MDIKDKSGRFATTLAGDNSKYRILLPEAYN
jgi:hypothetical protein